MAGKSSRAKGELHRMSTETRSAFQCPGIVKSFLRLRTGNAWVHLWAYHATAPHVTMHTRSIVRMFNIP